MNQISFTKCTYKVFAFALPISTTSLINIISNFFALFMVARLGKIELAASALAITTNTAITTIAATSLFAIGLLVSHYKAQSKPDAEISAIIKNGIWVALLFTLPLTLLLWFAGKLLILFGQDPILIKITTPYFHYAALSLLPTLIGVVFLQFHAGIGRPRFTMIIGILRLPFIIALSYTLIFGNCGFPQLGLAGVNYAFTLVQTLFCIGIICYVACSNTLKPLQIFAKPWVPDWLLCKKIFSLGMPIGLQFGGELTAMSIATYFIGFFGITALAASQIVSQYSILIIMPILGLSQAVAVLISSAYANNDFVLIKKYMLSALIIIFVLFALLAIPLLFLPKVLIALYTHNQHMNDIRFVMLTRYFFMIAFVVLCFDTVRHIFSATLRGF